MRCRLRAIQEEADPLGSRSYSLPGRSMESLQSSYLLHGVPCHPFILATSIAAYHLTALLNQTGFGEAAINRNYTYGISNRLSSLNSGVQVRRLPKTRSSLRYHMASKRKPLHTNVRHPPRNGQARRRPVEPLGSNIRVCLDFV